VSALYWVLIEVPPDAEQAWREWQTSVHVPQVLAQPGFLKARLIKEVEPTAEGRARYLMEYVLESLEALERYRQSEAAAALRKDHEAHFGHVVRVSRQVWTEQQRWD